MASETFRREVVVAANRPQSWQVLTDVGTLVDWISIIDDLVEHSRLDKYSAVLMDRIGPFKLRADLDISVTDVVDNERLRVTAAGEDRQVSSRIAIDVLLTVADVAAAGVAGGGAATMIVVDGTYQVTGKVATMGAGMIRQKATKVLDEFVGRATGSLGAV